MKIEIVSSETLKPSCPTPITLRSFKLSVMDQITPAIYNQVVLFYPAATKDAKEDDNLTTPPLQSQKLKKSLSQTLTHFNQLAGRIKDNIFFECNDDGPVYVEARIHGILLSDFLQRPDAGGVKQLVPIEMESPEALTGPLLLVQASFFDCGGLAIGVCMSHKLADASTLSTFIKAWAALGRQDKLTPSLLPHLDTTAFRFPGPGRDIMDLVPKVKVEEDHDDHSPIPSNMFVVVTKRFVFDASKIASLKAKAASGTVQQPTRFEAVTALIWKCVIAASTRSNPDLKHQMLHLAVNLRKRVEPPLPENSIGNLACCVTIPATMSEDGDTERSDIQLIDLVADLRQGIKEFCESKAKRFEGGDPDDAFEVFRQNVEEVANIIRRSEEINFFICINWCNFQFYEAADFGWGKPRWVSMVGDSPKNIVKLINTREGGGVEAWVSLAQQQMALFESDPQLLLFASSNPRVSV